MKTEIQTKFMALAILGLFVACDSGSGGAVSTGASGNETGDGMSGEESEGGGADDEGDAETTDTPDDDDGMPADDDGGDVPTMPPDCLSIIDNLDMATTPLIPATDGRSGAWYTYNDESETGTQMPPADPCMPFPADPSGVDGSFAARTTGSGFAAWGAGMGFGLNNEGCEYDDETMRCAGCETGDVGLNNAYDLSGYTGIAFLGRSFNGPLSVKVKIPTTLETPVDENGTCMPSDTVQCADSYIKGELFTEEWKVFQVPFESMRQEGWGEPFDFELDKAMQIQFQVGTVDFDFAVDSLCFY